MLVSLVLRIQPESLENNASNPTNTHKILFEKMIYFFYQEFAKIRDFHVDLRSDNDI